MDGPSSRAVHQLALVEREEGISDEQTLKICSPFKLFANSLSYTAAIRLKLPSDTCLYQRVLVEVWLQMQPIWYGIVATYGENP